MKTRWQDIAMDTRERLNQPTNWFPFPMLLSFYLATVLTGHVLSGINPRLGSPANVVDFDSEHQKDGSIWFSVSLSQNDEVLVTTNDRKVFAWPITTTSADQVEEFIDYLKDRVSMERVSSGLLNRVTTSQSSVVVAVDKDIKYLHLKPVLEALGFAGITSYAFETRKMLAATEAEEHSDKSIH